MACHGTTHEISNVGIAIFHVVLSPTLVTLDNQQRTNNNNQPTTTANKKGTERTFVSPSKVAVQKKKNSNYKSFCVTHKRNKALNINS